MGNSNFFGLEQNIRDLPYLVSAVSMEPLAAFSLACGVIQVVNIGTSVVGKCRQLYKDGTLSHYAEAEEMAERLTHLRTTLDLTENQGQDEILELSEQCSAIASDLIRELQS